MNGKVIGYWVTTGLVAVGMAVGGVFDLLQPEEVKTVMAKLGLPLIIASVLGFWKVAGALTILAPKLPRLKEWAYAGFTFDLTGAAAVHIAANDPTKDIVTPLILLLIALASWALRPESRRLGNVLPS